MVNNRLTRQKIKAIREIYGKKQSKRIQYSPSKRRGKNPPKIGFLLSQRPSSRALSPRPLSPRASSPHVSSRASSRPLSPRVSSPRVSSRASSRASSRTLSRASSRALSRTLSRTSSRASSPEDEWLNKYDNKKPPSEDTTIYKLPSPTTNCNSRSNINEHPGCQTYSCFDRENNVSSYSYDCDWKQYYDTNAMAYYYYNPDTGEARWVKPDGLYINGGLKKTKKNRKNKNE